MDAQPQQQQQSQQPGAAPSQPHHQHPQQQQQQQQQHYSRANNHSNTFSAPPQHRHPPQQPDTFLDHIVRSSLVDLLDKTLCVQLRDGKNYIGQLASFDQFSNVVLSSTIERRMVAESGVYHDVPLGVFIIRGENIVLMGTHDATRHVPNFTHVDKETFDGHYLKHAETQRRIAEATRTLLARDGLTVDEDDLV